MQIKTGRSRIWSSPQMEGEDSNLFVKLQEIFMQPSHQALCGFPPSGACGGSCTWTRGTTSLWRPRTDPISLESSLSASSPRLETLWGRLADARSTVRFQKEKRNQKEWVRRFHANHVFSFILRRNILYHKLFLTFKPMKLDKKKQFDAPYVPAPRTSPAPSTSSRWDHNQV